MSHMDAAISAWAAALAANGFCAGTFGYESPFCSDEDGDCCLNCWQKALTTFEPPEEAVKE